MSRHLILFAILFTSLVGCEPAASVKPARNPKVVVNRPIVQTVMDFQDFTGRLDAVKSVEIRSRVSGYITDVSFKEGDIVEEGAVLFQIDDRPYKAELNQSEANLKVAIADQRLQEKNLDRAQQLLQAKAASREEFETMFAASEKARASVGAMEAMRDRAKLYVDYTRVIAPTTGRISRRFVDQGNLILADNTVLTTIVAETPIFAYFDIDERSYLELLASSGKANSQELLGSPVMMSLANEADFTRVGKVDFIDNRIAPTTGTVRIRGVFDNPKLMLKAGLFVRIRLPIGNPYPATLIPDEAIQSDQERKFIWVVNAKSEVEYRSVTPGQAIRDWRVIRPAPKGKEGKEGVSEGEAVIVGGVQRVRKGLPVDVDSQTPPNPPEMPLVRLLNNRTATVSRDAPRSADPAPRD